MRTEGEWEYRYNNHDGAYEIGSDSAGYVGRIGTKKDAERIVSAVNCHEELVALAEAYRINRVEMRSMAGGVPELRAKYQEEIDRIDAVLAKARKGKS